MNTCLKIFILLMLPGFLQAQNENYYDYNAYSQQRLDSLQRIFNNTANATVRMAVSRDLGLYYVETSTDSAFYFLKLQLKYAKQLKQKLWEADAYDLLSYIFKRSGNYPEGLQSSLSAIKIAENPDTEKGIWRIEKFSRKRNPYVARLRVLGNSNHDLGLVYMMTGNNEKKMSGFLRAEEIGKEINDPALLSLEYLNIGNHYFMMNDMDSALYYEQKALTNIGQSGFTLYLGLIYSYLGNIYVKKENPDSARKYFIQSIAVNKSNGNNSYLAQACINMSDFLTGIKENDSALYYARMGLRYYTANGEPAGRLSAFKSLASIFRQQNLIDSAFEYQQLATAVSDSLVSADKIKQFENIGFDQQLQLQELEREKVATRNRNRTYGFIAGIAGLLLLGFVLYRNNRQNKKANAVLESTLKDLRAAQAQLIQSEKMASLGELTAGIAHEIQNPLNFVNNFSEVNRELMEELQDEVEKGNMEEVKAIANDAKENAEKINHHGKRADAIVKSMMQHSQSGTGETELVDINVLCDEYLRLSLHGVKAKGGNFNPIIKTDFDHSIGRIDIIPQDIGRVLMNVYNNAFYAVNDKQKSNLGYEPAVLVSTKKKGPQIEITVSDNGNGIPENIISKIFQPFFTTKPTGQGTGLGLSLAYDIVKANGGEIKVNSVEGKGSEFIITLNANS